MNQKQNIYLLYRFRERFRRFGVVLTSENFCFYFRKGVLELKRQREGVEKQSIEICKKENGNRGKLWCWDEFEILFEVFKGGTLPLNNKEAMACCVEILERSKKSIIWHYKHMFNLLDEEVEPKAGKLLIEFKRVMNLQRG